MAWMKFMEKGMTRKAKAIRNAVIGGGFVGLMVCSAGVAVVPQIALITGPFVCKGDTEAKVGTQGTSGHYHGSKHRAGGRTVKLVCVGPKGVKEPSMIEVFLVLAVLCIPACVALAFPITYMMAASDENKSS
jgi:hypothetical protein